MEYGKNRRLSAIGEKIFRGRSDDIILSKTMGVEEAEYMRMIELNALGKREYTNMRLRMVNYGLELPNYKKLVEFETTNLYPITAFYNGWRGSLPVMAEV